MLASSSLPTEGEGRESAPCVQIILALPVKKGLNGNFCNGNHGSTPKCHGSATLVLILLVVLLVSVPAFNLTFPATAFTILSVLLPEDTVDYLGIFILATC